MNSTFDFFEKYLNLENMNSTFDFFEKYLNLENVSAFFKVLEEFNKLAENQVGKQTHIIFLIVSLIVSLLVLFYIPYRFCRKKRKIPRKLEISKVVQVEPKKSVKNITPLKIPKCYQEPVKKINNNAEIRSRLKQAHLGILDVSTLSELDKTQIENFKRQNSD